MSELTIRVEPPRLDRGRVRLAAQITSIRLGTREVWFSLEERHRSALTERGDPFVLALLLAAMREGAALRVQGAPVSPTLLRNLSGFQEAWHGWRGYGIVDVEAEEERETGVRAEPALVAFSGGIDSAFTAYRHVKGRAGRQTRELHAGVMVHGFDIPLDDETGFQGALARSARLLESLGIGCISIATNVRTLLPDWEDGHGLAIAAALHVLGRGYGAGLVASSATYQPLIVPWGSNPVTDPMLSSDAFEIVHDGCGTNRLDKVRVLTEWDEAMESLRFCWAGARRDRNCGECRKCLGVAMTFRVLGVEPRCFDTPPSAEMILRAQQSRTHQLDRFSRVYNQNVLDEAERIGLDTPWVRALRRRMQRDRYERVLAQVWAPVAVRVDALRSRGLRAS